MLPIDTDAPPQKQKRAIGFHSGIVCKSLFLKKFPEANVAPKKGA